MSSRQAPNKEDFYKQRLSELRSFFRLPGYIRADTLMAFWGCNRSLVSRRMRWIDQRGFAIIRSEHLEGGKRWYWIDPYPEP